MHRIIKNTIFLIVIVFFVTITSVTGQVKTTVYEINNNPGNFINENVQVEGLVLQYIPGSSSTLAHYILKDDMGAEIQINTTVGSPSTNEKYSVTGVLYQENRRLFISEQSRQSLEPASSAPPTVIESDNTLTYIMISSGVLLLLVAFYFLYTKSEKKTEKFTSSEGDSKSDDKYNVNNLDEEAHKTFMDSSGDNTVVIDRDYMTMKALPGKLVVLNGDQADKKLSLFGANSPEGKVITIGRDSPDWKKHLKKGRENAHIRIKDSTQTVSRLQAELISSNGEMKLRNLAQANPTIVDDKQLDIGEMAPLKGGSVIQAGNLKLQYEL